MESIFNHELFQWFAQFAFEPTKVYLGLCLMMLASAVGLPLPEEVTLVSVGFLAFMGSRPDLFPPPFTGAPVVNVHEAAIIAFGAVVFSDCMIYFMGRKWGRKILFHPRLKKILSEEALKKGELWTKKYGNFAVFAFRFTPGVRFPGHLACGMLHFSALKFIFIDGLAALISVPTQIYLLATYGKEILSVIHKFKMILLGLFAVFIIFFILKKINEKMRMRNS
ncbi:MAG: DedA family protein [Bdellovibrionaceae bacterium]|nr:DedA family protein [Pseudobdellovibrionaceae bacterium]